MFRKLLSSVLNPGGYESPDALKRRQRVLMALGAAMAAGVIYLLFDFGESPQVRSQTKTVSMATPVDAVDEREIWVNRIEKQAEKTQRESESIRKENKLLKKKIDVIEGLFQKSGLRSSPQFAVKRNIFPPQTLLNEEQTFDQKTYPKNRPVGAPDARLARQLSSPSKKKGTGFMHLTVSLEKKTLPKTVDTYIPAGTYAKAILTSGVVASTATVAQGDPQPIFLRLTGRGKLPRGFKGDIKDAVLIGACYGDLSSERANCRLHKLTVTERNGEIIEKKVEGWIVGEDGRPGLKGDVVDRAGEVTREAFASGVLGGMAGFFQQQATSSVYPVSPFGQTDALKGKRLMGGAGAAGVGNALEKLADFSIKRAEQMQPVILVASGRQVDVVFKEGFDMSDTSLRQELTLLGQGKRLGHAKNEAGSTEIQVK